MYINMNKYLKLADLCRCAQCPHGSMNFEILAPHILMIVDDFRIISHITVSATPKDETENETRKTNSKS